MVQAFVAHYSLFIFQSVTVDYGNYLQHMVFTALQKVRLHIVM